MSPPVPPSLPNAAVSVLEEPQNRTSTYSLEHADLGAGYYRKYFYGKGEGHLQRAVLSLSSPWLCKGSGCVSQSRLPSSNHLPAAKPGLPSHPDMFLCLHRVHRTPLGWGEISSGHCWELKSEPLHPGTLSSSVFTRDILGKNMGMLGKAMQDLGFGAGRHGPLDLGPDIWARLRAQEYNRCGQESGFGLVECGQG